MGGKDFRLIFERLPFWIILVAAMFFGVRELGIKEDENKSVLSEAKKLKTITKKIPKRTVLNVSEVKEKAPAKVLQKPFTIQIAAFKDKAMAKKVAKELENKGYDTTISARDLSEKGTWYRVWVGNFVTEEQSEGLLRKLKEKYADSFVRLK